jgi:hypothetical protein
MSDFYEKLTRETLLARDAAVIRRAIQQLSEGKSMEADEFFDGVRSQLLAMKAAKARGKTK